MFFKPIRVLCLALSVLVLIWSLSACRSPSFATDEITASGSAPTQEPWIEPLTYEARNFDEVRAMWLSQFDLFPICVNEGKQRRKSDYIRRVEQLLENVVSIGINTLFVQVRPNGDSFYPSALFPSSRYATGRIGAAFDYDPFSILLARAHGKGLSVHAWINPLRCFSEQDRATLTGEYPTLIWTENTSETKDVIVPVGGVWYLNPSREAARSLICDGAREILSLYTVDGIHIDDYFYPTTDPSFDSLSFAEYQKTGGKLSLGEFRRNATRQLVSELHRTVLAAGGGRLFGVSPAANLERNYHELYADVERWCADGILDYLCPQIYFGWEHDTLPFAETCDIFARLVEKNDIRLIVGMTLGKAYDGYYGKIDSYAGTGAREWIEHTDILSRCFSYTQKTERCNGVAFFSYQFFFSPADGSEISETAAERASLLPLLKEAKNKKQKI